MGGAKAQWDLRLMPGPLVRKLGPGPSGEQGPCSGLWFQGDLGQPAYWWVGCVPAHPIAWLSTGADSLVGGARSPVLLS